MPKVLVLVLLMILSSVDSKAEEFLKQEDIIGHYRVIATIPSELRKDDQEIERLNIFLKSGQVVRYFDQQLNEIDVNERGQLSEGYPGKYELKENVLFLEIDIGDKNPLCRKVIFPEGTTIRQLENGIDLKGGMLDGKFKDLEISFRVFKIQE